MILKDREPIPPVVVAFPDAEGDIVTLAPSAQDPAILTFSPVPGGLWLTREQAGRLGAVLKVWSETGRLPDAP